MDDGDVLDEELHRHPGRPASPDRSRSQAQREDRRPPAHHPAAVHRDRRDHRRRRPHADADAVRPRPDHHGQQPGRVRRGVLRDHRRRSARPSITSGSPTEHGFGTTDLVEDRDHRRRHARGGEAAREGLQGRPDPRREVLRGHAHHGVRRPAARARARRLLLGRLPGRDRGGDRDPPRVRQADRREDAAHARRVRRVRRPDSGRSPARRSCSSATAPSGRASSHGKPVAIENLYKERSDAGPAHAQRRGHLRQAREGAARSSAAT